jgi:hypothetical protein
MGTKRKSSEAGLIEQFDIALENVEKQSVIATEMGELGYDTIKIAEGKVLLVVTQAAYKTNKKEDDEMSASHKAYKSKKDQLEESFKWHRKRALVALEEEPETIARLAISGAYPRSYILWYDTVNKFYDETTEDAEVQGKLAQLKVSLEGLTAARDSIKGVKEARAAYLKEKGESEDATEVKDAAIRNLEVWMSRFYRIAKIALEEKPQLLEALGKKVKS